MSIACMNVGLTLVCRFHNQFAGWIDTVEDNYPAPLSSQIHEILLGLIDTVDPELATTFWLQSMSKRLGVSHNITALQAMNMAAKNLGMDFGHFYTIPEQDAWVYSDGYSMVCDVLVCEMWKASGMFGNLADAIQCTEFTNWDAYSLNVFDANYKLPAACAAADPELPYCQILGKYRMNLNQYNTRPLRAHMAEQCPRGTPPDFPKPDGC
jgi:hypothetical protein